MNNDQKPQTNHQQQNIIKRLAYTLLLITTSLQASTYPQAITPETPDPSEIEKTQKTTLKDTLKPNDPNSSQNPKNNTNPTNKPRIINKIRRYMNAGERKVYLDLSSLYFTSGYSPFKIDAERPNPALEFKYKPPMQLILNDTKHPIFTKDDLAKLDSDTIDNYEGFRREAFEKLNFRIFFIEGTFSWIESYIVNYTHRIGGIQYKTEPFLKFTKYEYSPKKKKFLVTESPSTEKYLCLNQQQSTYYRLDDYKMGRLMEIQYLRAYGHFKLCFICNNNYKANNTNRGDRESLEGTGKSSGGSRERSSGLKNSTTTSDDLFFFQLDRLKFTGFYEPALESARTLLVIADPAIRRRRKDPTQFKAKSFMLKFYDDILNDAVFFFYRESYIYYKKNLIYPHTPNGGTIKLLGVQIEKLMLIHKQFFFVEGRVTLFTMQGRIDTNVVLVKNFQNMTKSKEFHFLEELSACLEKHYAYQYCFGLRVFGKLANWNLMPNSGNLLLQFIIQRRNKQFLSLYKWDSSRQIFENLMFIKQDQPLKLFFNTLFFNIRISEFEQSSASRKESEQDNDDKDGNTTRSSMLYHQLYISDRSFLGQGRVQPLKLIAGYGKSNLSLTSRDELVDYMLLTTNNILIRRGSQTITMFVFRKPELKIEVSPELSGALPYDSERCKMPINFNLLMNHSKYPNSIFGIWYQICHVPMMRVGSTFSLAENGTNFRLTLPKGVTARSPIRAVQVGSFLDIKAYDPRKGTSETSLNITKPALHAMTNFVLHFFSSIPGEEINGVFMTFWTPKSGKSTCNVIISTETDNLAFSGHYVPGQQELGFLNATGLRDFRDVSGYFPLNQNFIFIQIQEMTYYVKSDTPKTVLKPWNGLNGMCKSFVTLIDSEIGPYVLCKHDTNFYAKYINEKQETDTTMVKLGKLAGEFFRDNTKNFLALGASRNFPGHFMYFMEGEPSDPQNFKVAFFQITVLQSLETSFLLKYVSASTVSLQLRPFVLDLITYKDIIDISVAGRQILMAVQSYNENMVLVFQPKADLFSAEFHRAIRLPSTIKFVNNAKFQVFRSSETTNNLNFFPSNNQFFVSIEINWSMYCISENKVSTKRNVLMFDINRQTLNSMQILNLADDEQYVGIGPSLASGDYKREVFLALLLASKSQQEGPRTRSTVYNYTLKFASEVDPILLFDFQKSIASEENSRMFGFHIVSRVFGDLNRHYLNAQGKDNQPTSTIDNFYKIENTEYLLNFTYKSWIPSFRNISKNTTYLLNQNSSFLGSFEASGFGDFLALDLDNLSYTVGGDRFVKMDYSRFVAGNVMNSGGKADSPLEAELGIVKVINASSKALASQESCFVPLKSPATKVAGWCKNHLRDPNRKKRGCIDSDGIPYHVRLPPNYSESSKMWVISKSFLVYYSLDLWKCYKDNSNNLKLVTNTSEIVYRSDPAYFGKKIFYLETTQNSPNQIRIMVIDLDKPLVDGGDGLLPYLLPTNSGKQNPQNSSNGTKNRSKTKNYNPDGEHHIEIETLLQSYTVYYSDYTEISVQFEDLTMSVFPVRKQMDDYMMLLHQTDSETKLNYLTRLFRFWLKDTPKSDQNNGKKITVSDQILSFHGNSNQYTASNLYISNNCTLIVKAILTWDRESFFINLALYYIHFPLNSVDVYFTQPNTTLRPYSGWVESYNYSVIIGDFSNAFEAEYAQMARAVFEKHSGMGYFDIDPKTLIFSLSFPRGNDYLINLSLEELIRMNHPLGIIPTINNYKVLPISNPYIGTAPERDSKTSLIIGEMYFHQRHYGDKSFLIGYELDFSKMKEIDVNPDKMYTERATNRVYYQNIFAVKNYSPEYEHYATSKCIIQLDERPVELKIVPYYFPNTTMHEHLLIYTDNNGVIKTRSFSMKLNIYFNTDDIASRFISLFIMGAHNDFVLFRFKPSKSLMKMIRLTNLGLTMCLVLLCVMLAYVIFIIITRTLENQKMEEIEKLGAGRSRVSSTIGRIMLGILEDNVNFGEGGGQKLDLVGEALGSEEAGADEDGSSGHGESHSDESKSVEDNFKEYLESETEQHREEKRE